MIKNSLFIVMAASLLVGCASVNIAAPSKYSYDVYQYKLNNQDFAKVQKAFNTGSNNPALITLSYEKYWEIVDRLEQESFFSIYKYSNVSCKVQKSNTLTSGETTGDCSFSYIDKATVINLTANQYKNDDIYYTLDVQKATESRSQYTTKYNSTKEYFVYTYTDSVANLFFIIQKNALNVPWSTYTKTPQEYNSTPVARH